MPLIGTRNVSLGDCLRATSDNWEGLVTDINGEEITVTLHSGDLRTGLSADFYYNAWDSAVPTPSVEELVRNLDSLTDAVNQLILDSLMGGI